MSHLAPAVQARHANREVRFIIQTLLHDIRRELHDCDQTRDNIDQQIAITDPGNTPASNERDLQALRNTTFRLDDDLQIDTQTALSNAEQMENAQRDNEERAGQRTIFQQRRQVRALERIRGVVPDIMDSTEDVRRPGEPYRRATPPAAATAVDEETIEPQSSQDLVEMRGLMNDDTSIRWNIQSVRARLQELTANARLYEMRYEAASGDLNVEKQRSLQLERNIRNTCDANDDNLERIQREHGEKLEALRTKLEETAEGELQRRENNLKADIESKMEEIADLQNTMSEEREGSAQLQRKLDLAVKDRNETVTMRDIDLDISKRQNTELERQLKAEQQQQADLIATHEQTVQQLRTKSESDIEAANTRIRELTQSLNDSRQAVKAEQDKQAEMAATHEQTLQQLRTKSESDVEAANTRNREMTQQLDKVRQANHDLYAAEGTLIASLEEAKQVRAQSESDVEAANTRIRGLTQSLNDSRQAQETLSTSERTLKASINEAQAASERLRNERNTAQARARELSGSLAAQQAETQRAKQQSQQNAENSTALEGEVTQLLSIIQGPEEAAVLPTEQVKRELIDGIDLLDDNNSFLYTTPELDLRDSVDSKFFEWEISAADGEVLEAHIRCNNTAVGQRLWLQAVCRPLNTTFAGLLLEQTLYNEKTQPNTIDQRERRCLVLAALAWHRALKHVTNDNTNQQNTNGIAFVLIRCVEMAVRLRLRLSREDIRGIFNTLRHHLADPTTCAMHFWLESLLAPMPSSSSSSSDNQTPLDHLLGMGRVERLKSIPQDPNIEQLIFAAENTIYSADYEQKTLALLKPDQVEILYPPRSNTIFVTPTARRRKLNDLNAVVPPFTTSTSDECELWLFQHATLAMRKASNDNLDQHEASILAKWEEIGPQPYMQNILRILTSREPESS